MLYISLLYGASDQLDAGQVVQIILGQQGGDERFADPALVAQGHMHSWHIGHILP